ncbi:ArsR/SmtB family transcription factor [Fusibacter sp. JL216-2]|uniref:ArsR/SmtB family transcription factor n=1 Tax=Fusibacter sp. JL216-2 TaxID=3071453 RepID=UPI003D344E86
MNLIYQMQADYLKALAHPTRLRILELLRDQDELCVCHIIEDLALDQSNTSQHLRVLKKAGIVTSNKVGLKVFYKPVSKDVYNLIDLLRPLLAKQVQSITAVLESEEL